MESDIFTDSKLLDLFWDDMFATTKVPMGSLRLAKMWKIYIENKDIGLEFIKFAAFEDTYKIVDEKKWMLAKIKYGI